MEKPNKAAVETAHKNKVKYSDLLFLGKHYYEKEAITVYHFNVKESSATLTYIEKENKNG